MNRSDQTSDANQCVLCLQCLDRCPYIDLPREVALRERQELDSGGPAANILSQCVSCGSCDGFCENGCLPYQRILERWFERYRREGLPERSRFLLPGSSPNFRSVVADRLPPRERELVKSWGEDKGTLKGTVLYPGCNLIVMPSLVDTPLLEGIPIHGGLNLCCGEMYYRMGLFDEVERIATRLTEYYSRHEIETMLFICPACYNMFTNVLPERFGARFEFKTRFISEELLGRLEAGSLRLDRPVDRTVAVHDSCHARMMGPKFMESQRALLRAAGATPVDPEPGGEDGYCCGIAAGCSRYDPRDILKTSALAHRALRSTGAKETAVYCGGCLLTLCLSRIAVPGAPPVIHSLQYVRMAAGENPPLAQTSRALRIALGIGRNAFPALLSGRRFFLGG